MALVGNTNEEKIWNFLRSKGVGEYGVAGLMGNLVAESGLDPYNLENLCEKRLKEAGKPYCTDKLYVAAVDSGQIGREEFLHPLPGKQYGFGIAQWTSAGRKAGLYDLVKSRKVSIADLETQLDYLYIELTSTYKHVLNVLNSAKSVKEASDYVLVKFEAPADQGPEVKGRRTSNGQTIYNKYTGTKASTGNSSVSSAAVRIGHASRPEGSGVNGKAGDQTGNEVCIRTWYNGTWDFMALYPSEVVREKHAKACEAGCKNDHIGYSQFGSDNRNTLNALAKQVNYDLARVAKDCNTDCSAFQNVLSVASGASGVVYGSNGWTTANMRQVLKNAGYIIIEDPTYLRDASYCVRGAIYVKEGKHTVCGLDNGSNAPKTLAKAGLSGGAATAPANPQTTQTQQKTTAPTYTVGKVYTCAVELNVRKTPGTTGAKVGHSGLTANAKANDKDKDGAIDAGTKITCQEVRKIGNDIWIKIPSGWIAAYYQGKVYVK